MPLVTGSRLGPYEVLARLGEGGMGEVYRARDTLLDREVALKVLPPAVAQDPERLARFEREAKSLAALNHPHIAQIYAVEQGAIIMELVPGETLRGPLPIDTVLDYARQIAAALETAHDKGIIHRDLKPGNVMVTPEGVVKVLDFGLAGRTVPSSLSQDVSPTLTVHATQAGVIIGTAAYMSPEQAAGKPVDRRADIWSFGVILWELLTGARLFDGETVSHTLADVLRAEIDLGRLPRETPAAIRHLLERCLDRDVKSRLRDIGEVRVAIDKYVADPKTSSRSAAPSAAAPGVANRRPALAWSVAAIATTAALALAFARFRETPPAAHPVRYTVSAPERAPIINSIVLSPDGRRFAFVAPGPSNRPMLWVQAVDALDAEPLPGTEEAAAAPFWSHDSRFVFFGVVGFPGRLRRVDAAGGPPQAVAEYNGPFHGGDSSATGGILFSAGDGVWHIADEGALPTRLTTTDPARRETQHGGPRFLSDDRSFVYFRASNIPDVMGLYIGALDALPEAQSRDRLLPAESTAVFVPRSPGHSAYLLFVRRGTLVAQPVDHRSQPAGNVLTIAENVGNSSSGGWFSTAHTGVLSYRTAPTVGSVGSELVWFDRTGKRLGRLGPLMQIQGGGVAMSPDGKQVAVTRADPQVTTALGAGSQPGAHVWVADVARGVFSRLQTGLNESESSQVFASDRRVVFTTTRNGIGDLYWMSADGTGAPEPLIVKSPTVKHPNGVSPDGRFLIFDDHTTQQQDLWILPLTPPPAGGERKPFPFLATRADETFGQFSPDGRWIAYDSDESGTREVYVQGFDPDRVPAAASGKWQISAAGGHKPKWSRDGKELFYIAPDRKVMTVPVKIGRTFEPGIAVPLQLEVNAQTFFPYEVTADGRFLVTTPRETDADDVPPVTMLLNWQSALTQQ